jgi:hypothetical protein
MPEKHRMFLPFLAALMLATLPLTSSATDDTLYATAVFSGYWGIGGANNRSVAVDPAGNVYMSGGAAGPDWPTTDGSTHRGGSSDVAIAKFSPDGRMLWSILLGGPHEDYAYVSAVSDSGELYVSGRAGKGFPTTEGAFDRSFNGGIGGGPHKPTDAFVLKLSSDGKLIYSTYIGGSGDDNGRAIHLLPSGKLIVGGGNTTSKDMPTDRGTLPGPVLKPRAGGLKDSWIAVVAADGGSLDFLTYFGPNDDTRKHGDETIRALGVDSQGNIWIGGQTFGTDMKPTADAFQQERGEATAGERSLLDRLLRRGTGTKHMNNSAYIAKLSPDGRRLVYFSWLGGSRYEGIETEGVSDTNGNFYVAGSTSSADFPVTAGAFQTKLRGADPDNGFAGDGFVAKINDDGSLGFATLFGGSRTGNEDLFGPAVGANGTVCATGRFRSNDLPVTAHALQPEKAGKPDTQDSALACFSPDGKELRYASYFGGSGKDHGRHIAVGPDGHTFHIVGETSSRNLPLTNPPRDEFAGAFIAKFRLSKPAPAH